MYHVANSFIKASAHFQLLCQTKPDKKNPWELGIPTCHLEDKVLQENKSAQYEISKFGAFQSDRHFRAIQVPKP